MSTSTLNRETIVAKEYTTQITEFLRIFSDRLPENNYWAFSAYTVLIPSLVADLHYHGSLIPQSVVLGPLWNYLDAGCSIVSGLIQLTDRYHHRPIVNKAKGLLNCLSGTQVIVLTGLSFAVFGAPAFAASFAVGLSLSLDDTLRFARRMKDRNYCIKDSWDELTTINQTIIPDLDQQIKALTDLPDQESRMTLSMIECKKKRRQNYATRKEQLEKELVHCVWSYLHSQKKNINDVSECFPFLTKEFIDTLKKEEHTEAASIEAEENTRIEKDVQHFHHAAIHSFIWAVAFTAVLLLCIPAPPVQFAGVALLGVASLMYFAKNASSIGELAASLCENRPVK